MKTNKIVVSIIIPTRNEETNIKKCLDSIFAQETKDNFEIIVIDSGSTDRTVDIIKQYPRVKLIHIEPGEFGHGKTRNLGAERSKGEYIVFLNADALPVDNNWLNPLIRNLKEDKNKEIAGVYSRHVPKEGCHLYMARDILKSMPGQRVVKSSFKNLDFMIFSTVSCVLRREVWQRFPFDNRIIIAEDQDWAKRILSSGFKIVYEPGSRVYHSHNYKLKELFALKKKVGRTENKFKNKFLAVTLGFLFVIGGILVKICGDIFFIIFKSGGSVNRGSKPGTQFFKKIKQIGTGIAARIVGFAGRCMGWIGGEHE